MESDFKEIKSYTPLEDFGASRALWFESVFEREKRWVIEDIKILVIERIKAIANITLTEKQKIVFYLFLRGKSQREIAIILSISRNSVKCSWKQIKKNLQKHTTHLAYYWRL